MQISVVIPTCDRKSRLLSLLRCLNGSTHRVYEVIVVDSGNDRLSPLEISEFPTLNILHVSSERSVCIQRNTGIKMAESPWIWLCDDDIEVPPDYLEKLIEHISMHSGAGAVSGRWLEKQNEEWKATHPVRSAHELLWKYFFQLGIWGEIECGDNFFTRGVKKYYKRRGNHISKAGWPVNTDFGGEYKICPIYSLGASLVRKEWLVQSPFDAVLDRHGIGDNYGVAVDFPEGVHVVSSTFVYHHLEPSNRLQRSLQYYRRVLALDYFAKTRSALHHVKRYRVLWSLTGNMMSFLWGMSWGMIKANLTAMMRILFGSNPYIKASKEGRKVVEPML